MMQTPPDNASASGNGAANRRAFCVLVFDDSNLVAVRQASEGSPLEPAVTGMATSAATLARDAADAARAFVGKEVRVVHIVTAKDPACVCEVFFARLDTDGPAQPGVAWLSVREIRTLLAAQPSAGGAHFGAVLGAIQPHLIRVPYLNFAENEYVYRFRTEEQRNREIYASDERARLLYQSALCEAIKAVRRQRERTADAPALLDFGAVRYLVPSHFGFCLGVQNAIERAYETLAENPGRRVFMLSELIHNPFVNDDLRERGLVYLQSDRGAPFASPATGRPWWDELTRGDIVLTPAFGATDEDKVRLIERGVALNRYDATCMLVEKVWKAARRFALAGYTVLIHGKHEHEETKATFSNCAKYGPALVVRDLAETERLGEVILAPTADERRRLFAAFAGRHSAGFDVERDLDRLAVVNQTTLLRNETLGIIDLLESVMARRHGASGVANHLHANSRGDTLCYATQVNQDALERALAQGADAALVIGGRNSSNTFQLFRLCEARFGERAHYIQSERNILSRERVQHFVFPYKPNAPGAGSLIERQFLDAAGPAKPPTILVTGGASCPDGIIQQVIARINGFFPPDSVRPVETVLAELVAAAPRE
jgi:4-hydroxy-3-methylbut-2-en-1-yl diphosphate reductase